jgi:hypothetical protein
MPVPSSNLPPRSCWWHAHLQFQLNLNQPMGQLEAFAMALDMQTTSYYRDNSGVNWHLTIDLQKQHLEVLLCRLKGLVWETQNATHRLSLNLMHHALTAMLVQLAQAHVADITTAMEAAMAQRASTLPAPLKTVARHSMNWTLPPHRTAMNS